MSLIIKNRKMKIKVSQLKKSEEIFNNTIPGISEITMSNSSLTRRLVWTVALLICVTLAIWQLVPCFRLYYENKTAIYYKIKPIQAFYFPKIYICPSLSVILNRNLNRMFGYAIYAFRRQHHNLSHLWQLAEIDGTIQVSLWCEIDKICSEGLEISNDLTFHGNCVRIIRHEPVFGDNPFLKITSNTTGIPKRSLYSELFMMTISSTEELVTVRLKEFGNIIRTQSHHDILISFTEIRKMNLSEAPCVNQIQSEECLDLCIEKQIVEVHGCKLPFMKISEGAECHLDKAYFISGTLRHQLHQYQTDYESCNCLPPCHSFQYPYKFNFFEAENSETDIIIRFETQMRLLEEKFIYTSTDLISEVGGTLGFYIGFCFLTIMEIFELGINIMKRILLSKQ